MEKKTELCLTTNRLGKTRTVTSIYIAFFNLRWRNIRTK
jgi:hypothetical protein